jgi:multiple sugar transport system permease protein
MLSFARAAWLPLTLLVLVAAWILLERSPEQARGGVVLRWVVNSQERDQVFARAAKQAFEAEHPGIRIQFIKQNEGRKEETMIAGGDAPDVLQVHIDKLHYYVDAGILRDLTPMFSQGQRADLDSYFPVTRTPFQQGDRVYGVPWGYVPFLLFYNRNLFDKYGVAYPNEDWTWEDYRRAAKALTHDTDGDGTVDEFGAAFAQWQDGYYTWFFQNGGQVLSPDGTRAKFDDPRIVGAIDFLHRLTSEDRVMPTDVNRPKQAGLEPFEAGKLAMHGPTGSFYIPTYRSYERVDWDIASVPRGPGGRATIVAPIAFGVTRQSRHPAEALELVRFLGSEEGQWILADSGLFVPCRRDVALSDRFLKALGRPANKYALVAMMDDRDGRKPWGRVPPWAGDRWADVQDDALNGPLTSYLFGRPKAGQTPASVAADINARANRILDQERAADRGRPIPWAPVVAGGGVGAIALLGLWMAAVVRTGRRSRLRASEQVTGYLAIGPWLLGFLCFSLGPILFSVFLSFTRWNSLGGAETARWVGAANYRTLLTGQDDLFLKSLHTTGLYAALNVPLTLVSGLLLALLMNARLKGITLFRTLYYLPAVMPAVASAVLFRWLLGKQGMLNYLVGRTVHAPAAALPDWLGDPFWTVPAIVLMGLWGVGSGMMIYLAGLQNIPTQLYEAARIDGAGPLAQFRAVTFPLLSPVLFFNLVMGIIGALQVFTSAFVLFAGGTGPDDAALFYGYYLYRKAFEQFQIGYASALAWILFAVILVFTLAVFRSSQLWVFYEGQREAQA